MVFSVLFSVVLLAVAGAFIADSVVYWRRSKALLQLVDKGDPHFAEHVMDRET